jgi:hypothetical protein
MADPARDPRLPRTVRAPVRWAAPVAAAFAVASVGLVPWSFSASVWVFLSMYVAGLVGSWFWTFVAARFATAPPSRAVRGCTVDAAGIRTRRGALLVTAADCLGAELSATPVGRRIRLHDRRLRVYEVEVADDASAEALLETLDVRRRTGVTTFHSSAFVSQKELVVAIGLLFAVVLATVKFSGPILVPLAATVLFSALCATPSALLVGADGIYARWITRRWFIPIRNITRVDVLAFGAVVHTGGGGAFVRLPHEAARRFAARVAAAQGASSVAEPSGVEARIERGGRSAAAWLMDLKRVLRERSYRDASSASATLVRIVEDVARPAADRAAAAIALAAEDERGRPVVRGAARSTADAELRVALERVADGDEVDPEILDRLSRRAS